MGTFYAVVKGFDHRNEHSLNAFIVACSESVTTGLGFKMKSYLFF